MIRPDGLDLRLLEAILFEAGGPVAERELAARLPGVSLPPLLQRLSALYAGRGIELVQAGETWAFVTAADLAERLAEGRRVERKLPRAMLETLCVVAYHQPVTRREIEEIRGADLGKGTLDALFEQGWIAPVGRRETPGRPVTWGTTDGFLQHFGLGSIADLPGVDEIGALGLLDKRAAIDVVRSGAAGEAPAGPGAGQATLPFPAKSD